MHMKHTLSIVVVVVVVVIVVIVIGIHDMCSIHRFDKCERLSVLC